jgi:hypothetical protein
MTGLRARTVIVLNDAWWGWETSYSELPDHWHKGMRPPPRPRSPPQV